MNLLLLNYLQCDQVQSACGYFLKFTVAADRCCDLGMGRVANKRTALSPRWRHSDVQEPELRKRIVMSMRLREAFYPECEVVHMALSCCSKGSLRYLFLAITACFISNYLVFISDSQHLLLKWSVRRLMTEWVSPPTVFSFIVFSLWLVSEQIHTEA